MRQLEELLSIQHTVLECSTVLDQSRLSAGEKFTRPWEVGNLRCPLFSKEGYSLSKQRNFQMLGSIFYFPLFGFIPL